MDEYSFDGVKINQCTGNFGIHVGDHLVSDPDYAYDVVLCNTEPVMWNVILTNCEPMANSLGMHCTWQKTKLQNVGSGPPPLPALPAQVDGQTVESVIIFTYLVSDTYF